ncbi:hypothetical protein SFA35_10145 [Pseudomonas sp. HR96]|uniref:hypothetical protein n=1 Tax=Pseudomonas sp. HR96 TaxID=1027966 RepID=UPI002A74FEAD|nr:hypothetical protein [Pseudomonas sp. HR96]WPP01676.1 hypothetical protein SFA35_10145 [Pseudomonas sp. HR96]
MSDLQQVVESALSRLVGQPLTGAARAVDMLTLQLGTLGQRRTPLGRLVEAGQWALHVQCAWRVSTAAGFYVGREDYWHPAGASASNRSPGDWTPDLGNRWDERMSAWIDARSACAASIASVGSDSCGGLRLRFDDGYVLEVFPGGGEGEQWRLITWGSGDGQGQDEYFVIAGGRVET